MQTFLTDHQIRKSAATLDKRRLWKQILDAKKILNILVHSEPPFENPVVAQWAGFENFLLTYGLTMADDAWDRGMKSFGMKAQLLVLAKDGNLTTSRPLPPSWLGNPNIHASHRSYLLLRGEVDAICENIKIHGKIKSINKWLKLKGYKAKAKLDVDDFRELEDYCFKNNIDRPIKNWYAQWGWRDSIGTEIITP